MPDTDSELEAARAELTRILVAKREDFLSRLTNPFEPFIYAHVDPLEPRHIRYVGMSATDYKRPLRHIVLAQYDYAKSTHHINWIRKLLRRIEHLKLSF
jgi:hypothetical protein